MGAMIEEGLELLTEAECMLLMATVSVGRIGVTIGALPAIFPVNFAVREGAVYFRTGVGTKLAAAANHSVVAFEVDRVDPLEHSGWSVLAIGTATQVTDPEELASLSGLPLGPWAEGERDHLVRIPVELVSGRRIVHGRASEGMSGAAG